MGSDVVTRKPWTEPVLRRLNLSAVELKRLFPAADPELIDRATRRSPFLTD